MPTPLDMLMAQRLTPPQRMPSIAERITGGIPQDDPSWYRPDGSKKGMGFLGPLKFKDGRTSSELSIGVDFDGQQQEIPSLVPTLTKSEINHMLQGNPPTDEIVNKAVEHARMRLKAGKPVFAGPGDY